VTGRTGRFQRADRLLSSQDFKRVGRCGERLAARHFVVLLAVSENPGQGGRRRLGVTVSRRVGNAVVRNRIKRAVREWFRRRREQLESPLDLVVIARAPAEFLNARELGEVLDEMLSSRRNSTT
jgi:ribonuclease P protein component